jgi:ribosomal protein S18 acetylase RimI-like enzyme
MFRVSAYDRSHLAGVLTLCTDEGWMAFPSDPDRAHRVLTAPGVTTSVALDDDSVVLGFAQLLSDGEIQTYLANLLVAETGRGQGIARSLLEHVLGRAGGERVSLLSEDGSVGFYAGLSHQSKPGFRIYPPFTREASAPGSAAPGSGAPEASESAPPNR